MSWLWPKNESNSDDVSTQSEDSAVTQKKTKYPGGYDYDPYDEWVQERLEENEQRKKDVEDELATMLEEYHQNKKEYEEIGLKVPVKVMRGEDDRFLTVPGVEHVPCSHIESISVSPVDWGGKPYITEHPRIFATKEGTEMWLYAKHYKNIKEEWPYEDKRIIPEKVRFYVEPNYAKITIKLASGTEHFFHCWDYQVQDFLEEIRSEWRGGCDFYAPSF